MEYLNKLTEKAKGVVGYESPPSQPTGMGGKKPLRLYSRQNYYGGNHLGTSNTSRLGHSSYRGGSSLKYGSYKGGKSRKSRKSKKSKKSKKSRKSKKK
jgi:hypothetical protein